MLNILVVCTANICRSPAAQLFLVNSLPKGRVAIDSAGTRALNGNFADKTVQELMIADGFSSISEHRSRPLSLADVSRYGLILCMERNHINHIQSLHPATVGKTRLLGHWSGQKEVDDPVGGPRDVYASSLSIMKTYSDQWAQKIIELDLLS